MKKLALVIFLFSCSYIHAQTIQPASGSQLVYQDRLKQIDTLINDYIRKGYVKGIATIIVKDNQLLQYKAYGYANAETKTPMQANDLFRIMSQTKAITSVAIMMLYEQKKLSLDEPVSDFIPAFKNPVVINTFNATDTTYTTIPAKREITIRDLLTHSSGIDYADIGSAKMKAIYAKAHIPSGLGAFDATLLDKMKALAKLPLAFQPGERWAYGLNTDVLGCVVEVISGMSLEQFFTTKIFEPLGMKDTYFNVPASKAERLTTVYTEDAQHQVIPWSTTFRNINPAYPLIPKHYFSGGAGLTSTAYDYAIFMQMLLNKGKYNGIQILSPNTIDSMTTEQLPFLINDRDNFGLGFEITSKKSAEEGPRSEGSFGWGGYLGTVYWADPKQKLICLFMIQQTPNSHGEIEKRFEQLVYQSLQ